MRPSSVPLFVLAAGLLGVSLRGQQPPPAPPAPQPLLERIGPNAYDVVANWALPYPKAGYAWGSNPGVFVESPDRILVAIRGEIKLPDPIPAGYRGFYGSIFRNAINAPGTEVRNCLRVVNASGVITETWSQWDRLFEGTNGPHKIRISPYDPQRRVWVVGETKSVIYVFSNDGKQLLMTLGEDNVMKEDETHFGRPQDVAFLRPGLPAMVKISAYDFGIYGGLKGHVKLISPDTLQDDHAAPGKPDAIYYRVQVLTENSELVAGGKRLPIIPGMTGTVEIRTGEKTVLSYLLKPIFKAREAFRER